MEKMKRIGKRNNQPVAKITKIIKKSSWVYGTVGDYEFMAMVFDEPSSYGIEEGRVSTLIIYQPQKAWSKGSIVNFDRDWYRRPDETSQPIYDAVMKTLNSFKREE